MSATYTRNNGPRARHNDYRADLMAMAGKTGAFRSLASILVSRDTLVGNDQVPVDGTFPARQWSMPLFSCAGFFPLNYHRGWTIPAADQLARAGPLSYENDFTPLVPRLHPQGDARQPGSPGRRRGPSPALLTDSCSLHATSR